MTLGTFFANMISCLILGLVLGYQAKHGLSQEFKSLLVIGFCGGFSTFSTFSYELLNYIQKGEYMLGVGYLLLSVIISIILIIIGTKLI
jgi:CrcB protein